MFFKIDRQVIADGIENINEEALTVRGGETRTICTRKMRFIDSNGKKYIVGVIHDITERKKSEDSLKESENQLKELNATKDKLFTIIGHDLRSPFHNIIGFSELLIQNITNFEESEKFIRILNSSAKKTLVLLDNLLNWAKSQTGQLSFSPANMILSGVLEEIITHTKSLAETKSISVTYSATDDLEVYADENMLKTVLRNLFSNAIKFTKFGGHIQVFAMLKQDHVEISISDDGIGIDSDDLAPLLRPMTPPIDTMIFLS